MESFQFSVFSRQSKDLTESRRVAKGQSRGVAACAPAVLRRDDTQVIPYRYFLISLLLLLAMPTFAQDEILLILNEPLVISLSPEAPMLLTYSAEMGDLVSIYTEALGDEDAPDTVIWVLDLEARLLAYDDDSVQLDEVGAVYIERNARIENLRLPSAGLYSIYVDSFNGLSEGDVEVTLVQGDYFSTRVEETITGLLISATLPENETFRYDIDAQAGDVLTITARDTSGTLDPLVRVVDSNGTIIAANDDHASADFTLNIFDARIGLWEVSEGARYTIELLDLLGRSGKFELSILSDP